MAQPELAVPGFKIKPAAVPIYVKAFCALTGELEPEGEVTAAQFHKLQRAVMNRVTRTYLREVYEPTAPEPNE